MTINNIHLRYDRLSRKENSDPLGLSSRIGKERIPSAQTARIIQAINRAINANPLVISNSINLSNSLVSSPSPYSQLTTSHRKEWNVCGLREEPYAQPLCSIAHSTLAIILASIATIYAPTVGNDIPLYKTTRAEPISLHNLPDRGQLSVGLSDGSLAIIDSWTAGVVQRMPLTSQQDTRIMIEGERDIVYAGSKDGWVTTSSLGAGHQIDSTKLEAGVCALLYHPQKHLLIATDEEKNITAWDTRKSSVVLKKSAFPTVVGALTCGSHSIIGGAEDGTLYFWKTYPLFEPKFTIESSNGRVASLFSLPKKHLLVCQADEIMGLSSSILSYQGQHPEFPFTQINALNWDLKGTIFSQSLYSDLSPDLGTVVSATPGHEIIKFWDLPTVRQKKSPTPVSFLSPLTIR